MSNENVVCPSGLTVQVRKAKIRDFQLLQDRKEVKAGRATANLIKACVTSVVDAGPYGDKLDWSKVLVGDQMVAMMAVRRVTHGDAFDFDVMCPYCRARISWSVNLSELKMQPYSAEAIALFKERKPCAATVIGKEFLFDHVTVELAARAAKLIESERRNDRSGSSGNGGNALAEGLLVRLLSVEGVEKSALREWVEDLDLDVLRTIRKELERYDGGIETEINVECESCGAAPEIELPLDLRRFWLSAG